MPLRGNRPYAPVSNGCPVNRLATPADCLRSVKSTRPERGRNDSMGRTCDGPRGKVERWTDCGGCTRGCPCLGRRWLEGGHERDRAVKRLNKKRRRKAAAEERDKTRGNAVRTLREREQPLTEEGYTMSTQEKREQNLRRVGVGVEKPKVSKSCSRSLKVLPARSLPLFQCKRCPLRLTCYPSRIRIEERFDTLLGSAV